MLRWLALAIEAHHHGMSLLATLQRPQKPSWSEKLGLVVYSYSSHEIHVHYGCWKLDYENSFSKRIWQNHKIFTPQKI